MSKKDLELSDGIKKTKTEVFLGQKSDFDYFRYLAPQQLEESDSEDEFTIMRNRERKNMIKAKFSMALMSICAKIKNGELEMSRAMQVLQGILEEQEKRRNSLFNFQAKAEK